MMQKTFTTRNAALKNFLISGRHIHPLVIMLIDIMIIFLSFSLAYSLIAAILFNEASMVEYSLLVSIYCMIVIPIMYSWRLHTGLLRFSNTMDLSRVFGAVITFSITLFFLVLLFGNPFFGANHRSIYFVLGINFFISVSFLIVFRLVAKSIYVTLIKTISNAQSHRVLIYGADHDAVLVKQALESDREVNYFIAGFIDTDPKVLNSYLEQKKVYPFKNLLALKKRLKIDQLLIVNENLDERSKKVVIERCIRAGVKVLTVPPTRTWLSGKINKNKINQLRIEDLLQRPSLQINSEKVKGDLSGKRVLITGAAGSIGSELVRQILSYEPALLILCDQAESPLHEIQLEIQDDYPNAKIETVLVDICNYARLEILFHTYRPNMVYHAAAYKHVPMVENNPFEAVAVNVEGTKNIADLAVSFQVEKFVMISTDKALNPSSIMGASKRLAEIYIQSLNRKNGSGTRFMTTRFGNVLGSTGSIIPRFRSQIAKGGPITVTHPEIRRYFMTTSEAVQLVLEAGTMGRGGEIYTFDMGNPVKIIDLAKKMIQLAGLIEGKDIKISIIGLRPGEKLCEGLLASTEGSAPTSHDKIRIAEVRPYSDEAARKDIDELLALNKMNNNEIMVLKIMEIVPEFLSDNPTYMHIDAEVKTA